MNNWKLYESHETNDLIDIYQNSSSTDVIRENSFLAICFRFRGDLIRHCEVICKKKNHDSDTAIKIVERTFLKYGKTKAFKIEKGNQETVYDCFLLYLLKIARNELIDYYKEEVKREKGQLYDGTERIITEVPNIEINTLDPKEKIIHSTLLSLPHSHQVVYLTYKTHEKEGVNLPKSLRESLRDYLGGISQTTIRTYKKEAIDKMELAKKVINEMATNS